jgi:hypothetical protein
VFLKSLFTAAKDFYEAKPWLYLRVNHVIAIDCGTTPFKYIQILGGTGSCDPMLHIHRSWDTVQNENEDSYFVSHASAPPESLEDGYMVSNCVEFSKPVAIGRFQEIEIITRHGLPISKVADSKRISPFELITYELPWFHKVYTITPRSGRRNVRVHNLSFEELVFFRFALHTVTQVIKSFVLSPGSSIGDQARFYDVQEEVSLPSSACEVVHPSVRDVRVGIVRFPVREMEHRMSVLQRIAMAGKAPTTNVPTAESPSPSFKFSAEILEHSRDIMQIKERGNDAYKNRDFEKAYEIYRYMLGS